MKNVFFRSIFIVWIFIKFILEEFTFRLFSEHNLAADFYVAEISLPIHMIGKGGGIASEHGKTHCLLIVNPTQVIHIEKGELLEWATP